ncbi:MAG: trypsin-like peptidase domain-containing protein, partial [Alphaproteobacteria bacterium]|nr:trypsin-like peptidase domain-containing protein [Alphaproteobacteria bacterium]
MKKIALLVISLFFSYNSYAVTATNIADLVPEIIPAVVNISTTQKIMTKGGGVNPMFPQGSPFEEFNEFFERFGMVPGWEGDEENPRNAMSLGTGFIVDGEGYIVTNFHVIQNSEEITVTLNDNTKYQAEIIGSDNKTDLALL